MMVSKKSETSDPNISNNKKKAAKLSKIAQENNKERTWRDPNAVKAQIDQAYKLVKENDQIILISQIYHHMGMTEGQYYNLLDFDFVKEFHEWAKDLIAERREIAASFNKMNTAVFFRHQHLWKKNYHEDVNMYHLNLKKQEQTATNINPLQILDYIMAKKEGKDDDESK